MLSENELKYFPIKQAQRMAFRRIAVPHIRGVVADIGGGWGPYHGELRDARIITMDWVRTSAVDIVGSALEIPFKDGTFDCVMLTEVLEHVCCPETVLKDVWRILKPGGKLYLTAPQMWPLHYEPHDYYRFTSYGLSHLLVSSGFSILTMEPVGRVFTFIAAHVGAKGVKTGVGLFLGWLPKKQRWQIARVAFKPCQWILYQAGRALDKLSPRNVVGWAVLAYKPEQPDARGKNQA
jgi:SAM-dependent methyltransferase